MAKAQKPDPQDKPTVSPKEIEQLPRWARVAFAARCARRVQPRFDAYWPEAPQKYIDAVDQAIVFSARVADDAAADDAAVAYAYAREADAAARAADAADDVAHAAYADADVARTAALAAADAAAYGGVGIQVRADFEHLLTQSQQEGWDDTTSVAPEVFGPMWPGGPPEDWPPVDHETGQLFEDQLPAWREAQAQREREQTQQALLDSLSKRLEHVEEVAETQSDSLDKIVAQIKPLELSRAQLQKLEKVEPLVEDFKGLKEKFEEIKAIKESLGEIETFWEKRKKKHGWSFLGFGLATGLVLVGVLCKAWRLYHDGLPDFSSGQPELLYWRMGLSAFMATLVLLLLRIMTRITMSHLHLATEAEERVVMFNSYLNLLGTRVKVTNDDGIETSVPMVDKERQDLVLNALFRPSSTGLVKDDAVPASVLDLATRVAGSGKGQGG